MAFERGSWRVELSCKSWIASPYLRADLLQPFSSRRRQAETEKNTRKLVSVEGPKRWAVGWSSNLWPGTRLVWLQNFKWASDAASMSNSEQVDLVGKCGRYLVVTVRGRYLVSNGQSLVFCLTYITKAFLDFLHDVNNVASAVCIFSKNPQGMAMDPMRRMTTPNFNSSAHWLKTDSTLTQHWLKCWTGEYYE